MDNKYYCDNGCGSIVPKTETYCSTCTNAENKHRRLVVEIPIPQPHYVESDDDFYRDTNDGWPYSDDDF